MRQLLLFITFFSFLGCNRNQEAQLDAPEDPEPEIANTSLTSASRSCAIDLPTLEGNRYTDTEKQQLLALTGDSSDWSLQVYDRRDCQMLRSLPLPEPQNADYPYFLADLLYNSGNRLLGIRGHQELFIYDLEASQLSAPIAPQFKLERLQGVDAGQIEHLEVWEDYLVGCSSDWGSFVFRLDSLLAPSPVMPVAELEKEGVFHSLFLIESGLEIGYQAILPTYDYDQGTFRINPLFEAPIALEPAATIYADGSPYARLRKSGADLVGVDLVKRELIEGIEAVEVDE